MVKIISRLIGNESNDDLRPSPSHDDVFPRARPAAVHKEPGRGSSSASWLCYMSTRRLLTFMDVKDNGRNVSPRAVRCEIYTGVQLQPWR